MLHEKSCCAFTEGASKDNTGLLRGSSTFCYFVWWIALTGIFLARPISKLYVCRSGWVSEIKGAFFTIRLVSHPNQVEAF